MQRPRILLVEDDAEFRGSLAQMLQRLDYEVVEADSVAAACEALEAGLPDAVLLDLELPDGSGLDLRRQEQLPPHTPFVVLSGNASTGSARDALEIGASEYLTKPVDPGRLREVLGEAVQGRALRSELGALEQELREAGRFGPMVGRSGRMQRVYDLISRVAPTEAPVLVTGESGCGKELVAQTLHKRSRRRDGPFIALNCGAMPESLIESALFGHAKGAFTGATEDRKGVFEEADGGTLFLDEIGEMPMDLQVRLLRVLETGRVTPVGSTRTVDVGVRIVAATNRDPQQAIAEQTLREDLFFRLNVFPIELPPLRDRGEDVLLIADHFLDAQNEQHGLTKFFAAGTREALRAHPWPGNVRELRNAIERAWIMSGSELGAADLGLTIPGGSGTARSEGREVRIPLGTPIADAERVLIEATLRDCDGNKRQAARVLGISVKTLYNRLNAYAQGAHPSGDAPSGV